MQSFFARVRQFLGRLSAGQQIGLAVVALGTLGLLLGTMYWSSQPEYALLFGDLNPEDANRVVSTLREEGTPYDLRNSGSAVYVPRSSVHELRLRFSSEGVVKNGQTGYELFDESTLGMTNFMQKLNSKRALEGELARTISSMRQVERARVHLVKPDRDPFQDEETKASASVVLGLQGGSMSSSQVQGVTELVAGAVEELGPNKVTVLDSDGRMLSEPNAGDEDIQLTSTQLDMQRSVEEQLAEQGQSMLEKVVGPGNAVVRVSAELDFDRTVTEKDLVDPESATVVSEERMQEEGEETGSSNSVVRNFEVSRTQKRSEESVGDVSRLTVSVVVDHKKTGEGEEGPTYEPRTDAEMAEIESLVKNAVGFDADRGDEFSIQQNRLAPEATQGTQVVQEPGGQGSSRPYLRYGLILAVVGLGLWLARSLGRRLTEAVPEEPAQLEAKQAESTEDDTGTQLEEGGTPEALKGESDAIDDLIDDDVYTSKLSDEAKAKIEARSEMFEEIQDQAKEHPEQTAEMIRSWLVKDQQV